MSLLISNFCRRVADYVSQNKARLGKLIFILALIVGAALLLYGVVYSIQTARYEKRVNALDQQFKDAEAKAKEAEAKADAIARQLDAKQSELQFLEAQAKDADRRLQQTRTVYLPLKERYEETRIAPLPAAPVSCES